MILIMNAYLDQIDGEIKIMFNIVSPTRDISLHAYGLIIFLDKIKLKNACGWNKSYTLLGYCYCSVPQILVRFNHTMVGVYNLTIQFFAPYSSRKGIVKYHYNENTTFGKETR